MLNPQKKYGTLWIYKNEILSDISKFSAGTIVKVYESKTNKIIGTGYVNPKSTISVRLLSFKDETVDEIFFKKKNPPVQKKYREEFLGLKENYRLIFSESDFLPGLIVDKYDRCIVIQITTAGMEQFKDLIIKILDEILCPELIILKNDSPSRLKEGLKIEKQVIKGQLDELPVIVEDDVKFIFDPINGQKKQGFSLIREKIELS